MSHAHWAVAYSRCFWPLSRAMRLVTKSVRKALINCLPRLSQVSARLRSANATTRIARTFVGEEGGAGQDAGLTYHPDLYASHAWGVWLLVGELFHPLQEMQPIYLARRCPNLALRQISIGVRQLEAAQLGEVARHPPRLIHGQHAGAPGRSRRHNQSLGCDAGGGFTGVTTCGGSGATARSVVLA